MKDKFLFCLFDGLRRDIVRQDTMPNLSAFREGWVDFPNSSSAFRSDRYCYYRSDSYFGYF